jgi:hypothetical protein
VYLTPSPLNTATALLRAILWHCFHFQAAIFTVSDSAKRVGVRLNIKNGAASVGVISKAGLTGAYGGDVFLWYLTELIRKLTHRTVAPFLIIQQKKRISLTILSLFN